MYRTGFTGNVAHLTMETAALVVLALEVAALLLFCKKRENYLQHDISEAV